MEAEHGTYIRIRFINKQIVYQLLNQHDIVISAFFVSKECLGIAADS